MLCSNATGKISCRIGIAIGQDEKRDAKNIMNRGGKLFQSEAIAFFPDHKELILKNWKED